ncbi:carboxypeptidase regulatory-like domain-containing protein [Xanthomonas arboricola]|uniref:carboxypeptidase regulatory-like domain-containing protein n=1 Tax=Xanthomonas arboricola TaxID=56448 RepID=UPI000E1F4332|nr:carboxypeptidase regulatory-like domain-containing protein [Xanthomonas arboricola]
MPAWIIIATLAGITLLAWWRLRRAPIAGWRKAALLALQPLCAALLYCALVPPSLPGHGGTLVVATAGSDTAALTTAPGDARIALPEAPAALRDAERMPDLATALRRHPGTTGLRIVGAGLPARDRDTARGWPLRYTAPAPTRGLSELSTPSLLAPGADLRIHGRITGVHEARLELLDPAGRRVDLVAPDADGRFQLGGSVRAAGDSVFVVRVLGPDARPRDQAEVPVSVVESPAANLWIIAGAPQPELKYLRRWAHDAGLDLHTQIATGGGMQLGDAPRALDAATLDRSDLLILDERALASLSRLQRDAVRAAVERGLGLLLRLGGPLDAAQHTAIAALGLPLRGDNAAAPLLVAPASNASQQALHPQSPQQAADARAATSEALPTLERRTLVPDAPDAIAVLRASNGTPYAWWRAIGRGRIGLIAVTDSYRLVLQGQSNLHAALWSQTLSPLTRAQPTARGPTRVGWRDQRISVCNLSRDAQLLSPDGTTQPLPPDPGTGAAACAALWPEHTGWYRWQDATRSGALYIRAPADAPALFANTQRDATRALINHSATPHQARPTPQPGPRWPWWLGFVAAAAVLWWLERWRGGRSTPAT